jgi:protein-S-isoprenylcysteine O-methyltransferase Ste14
MRREAPSRIPVVVAGVALGGADHLGFCLQLVGAYRVGLAVVGDITRKPGHEVIDRGAFAIVRHPIYTGILLAVFGTLLVKGTILGIIGALLIPFGPKG